jgi:hypothetical protein
MLTGSAKIYPQSGLGRIRVPKTDTSGSLLTADKSARRVTISNLNMVPDADESPLSVDDLGSILKLGIGIAGFLSGIASGRVELSMRYAMGVGMDAATLIIQSTGVIAGVGAKFAKSEEDKRTLNNIAFGCKILETATGVVAVASTKDLSPTKVAELAAGATPIGVIVAKRTIGKDKEKVVEFSGNIVGTALGAAATGLSDKNVSQMMVSWGSQGKEFVENVSGKRIPNSSPLAALLVATKMSQVSEKPQDKTNKKPSAAAKSKKK